MEKSKWQRFFDHHAEEYLNNDFTSNTEFEVEFIIRELVLQPGQNVLDIGCGTGRHSIPLAEYGASMTGIDLSEGMLNKAREYASEKEVSIELIRANATEFRLPQKFDHAICLCEGSLGLLGSDENASTRDLAILENIYACLKPGAKFILTVLNGLKKIREHSQTDVDEGKFDPINLISYDRVSIIENGESLDLIVKEKGFTPAELAHIIKQAGFEILNLWGGTAGSWNKQILNLDEYEIMVIAQKPSAL